MPNEVIPFPARWKPYAASGPHCGEMEMSEVEIWEPDEGGFEAELHGDAPVSGDAGYSVSVAGWGPTEADALANLAAALDNLRRHVGDFRSE